MIHGLGGEDVPAGASVVTGADGSTVGTYRPGARVSIGRSSDRDIVIDHRFVSRDQAELQIGDGYAVLRRNPNSKGEMWAQFGQKPTALAAGEDLILHPGRVWVRMHTDRSIHPTTGMVLDPVGTAVLLVRVGLRTPAGRDGALISGVGTAVASDEVRTAVGYPTLVALCADLLRDGSHAEVPDDATLVARLAGAGIKRAAGTCRNDITKFCDDLGLRDERSYVAREKVARTAVTVGWVTLTDVRRLLGAS